MIEFLLNMGADIHAITYDQKTPLTLAIEGKNWNAIKFALNLIPQNKIDSSKLSEMY